MSSQTDNRGSASRRASVSSVCQGCAPGGETVASAGAGAGGVAATSGCAVAFSGAVSGATGETATGWTAAVTGSGTVVSTAASAVVSGVTGSVVSLRDQSFFILEKKPIVARSCSCCVRRVIAQMHDVVKSGPARSGGLLPGGFGRWRGVTKAWQYSSSAFVWLRRNPRSPGLYNRPGMD